MLRSVLLVCAFVTLLVTYAGMQLAGVDTSLNTYPLVACESIGVALMVARLIRNPKDRLPWTFLTFFAALWTVGDSLYVTASETFGVMDASYMLSYVCACVGTALLMRRLSPHSELGASLDGLVVAITLSAALVALPLGSHWSDIAGTGWMETSFAIYLCFDLILLCLICVGQGLSHWQAGPAWYLMFGAVIAFVVGDLLWTVALTRGIPEDGTVSVIWNLLYPIGIGLLAVAAHTPENALPLERPGSHRIAPPVLSALGATLIVMLPVIGTGNPAGTGLAGVALLLAVLRNAITVKQNVRLLELAQHEALTDGLTGLGNRRAFMQRLNEAEHSASSVTLVFIDLDGFKAYNDTLGHAAGDGLLQRIGDLLRTVTAAHGAAYRLGGDEFCLILNGELEQVNPVMADLSRLMVAEDPEAGITASLGTVSMPREAATGEVALNLADERMYRAKRARREGVVVAQRDRYSPIGGQ